MNLLVVPVSKTMQVDTSLHPPASKMEVINEIGFLKRQKTPGAGSLSPSFNCGDEIIATELNRLMGHSGQLNGSLGYWCKSKQSPIYTEGDRSSRENHK